MNPTPTEWLPGIVVLSSALFLAGLAIFFSRRKGVAPPATDAAAQDADERGKRLLEQLRELTLDRHHLTDVQFTEEKGRLEQLAAQAFRERDALRGGGAAQPAGAQPASSASAAAAPARAPGFFTRHPKLVGAAWGAGIALFFVTLGLVLGKEERPRTDSKGPMAGASTPGAAATPGADNADAELKQAMDRLHEHPEDVELAARVAHELIRRREFSEARAVTERSVGQDPFHVETRVHRAFLRAVFGDNAGALKELMHVADTYPGSHEALLFAGMLELSTQHNDRALADFERFLAEAPPDDVPPQMFTAMQALRQQLGRSPRP